MNIYKYFCSFCGEVSETIKLDNTRVCGHCKRSRKELIGADKLTDIRQLMR